MKTTTEIKFTDEEIINEVWKDVVGYETLYEISSLGRVKSVERNITRIDGRNFFVKQKILIATPDAKGYLRVVLHKNNIGETKKVHRLVLESFLKNPNIKQNHVNHLNFNKADNRLENLEWVSREENFKHAIVNGHFGHKLKSEDIIEIKRLAKIGIKTTDLAKQYSVSIGLICLVLYSGHRSTIIEDQKQAELDEKWVPVIGFENHYLINKNGDIKSVARTEKLIDKNGKIYTNRRLSKKLKPYHKRKSIALFKDKKLKHFLIKNLIEMHKHLFEVAA